jgi:hypothetical protein
MGESRNVRNKHWLPGPLENLSNKLSIQPHAVIRARNRQLHQNIHERHHQKREYYGGDHQSLHERRNKRNGGPKSRHERENIAQLSVTQNNDLVVGYRSIDKAREIAAGYWVKVQIEDNEPFGILCAPLSITERRNTKAT